MTIKLITATTLLSLAAAAHAYVGNSGDTFERTFTVSNQPDLYVSTGSGNVRVFPGAEGTIKVVGHVHAGWSAFGDINTRVQHIVDSPPITQSGNAIHVGETTDRSLFNNINIDYEVTAPPSVALNLHSGSGDVEIDHIGRYLSASSGSGNVRAHGIHGPAELQSGSGDLELQEEGTGDVKAKTGSGSIRINGLNGSIQAKTGSGDIEANGRLNGPSNLTSGSGSVRLHIASDAHFDFEAMTGSGDIRLHFPNTNIDNDAHHHVTASVNGGGPALSVHTGSGDIECDGTH